MADTTLTIEQIIANEIWAAMETEKTEAWTDADYRRLARRVIKAYEVAKEAGYPRGNPYDPVTDRPSDAVSIGRGWITREHYEWLVKAGREADNDFGTDITGWTMEEYFVFLESKMT
jgi:hypothetical protein